MATNTSGQFVAVATFVFADEALIARGLLQSAGIVCYLENEHILTMIWAWNYAFGGIRLMAPVWVAEEAGYLLNAAVSEDNTLNKEAGGRRLGIVARSFLAFFILFSPNHPEHLRLVNILASNPQFSQRHNRQ